MLLKLSKDERQEILSQAASKIKKIFPVNYESAPDLKNYSPTSFVFGNDGSRLSGDFLTSDVTIGAPSPGLWSYFSPILCFSCLSLIFAISAIGYFAITPFLDLVHALSYKIVFASGREALGSAIWGMVKSFMLLNAILMIPTLTVAFFVYLFLSEQEHSDDFTSTYWMLVIGIAVATVLPGTGIIIALVGGFIGAFKAFNGKSAFIVLAILSPFLGAIISIAMSLAGILAFRMFFWLQKKSRDEAVRAIAVESKNDSLRRDLDAMEETRSSQAAYSLDDKSPVLPIGGTSLGVLRKDGDPLTWDQGALACLSVLDLSMHLLFTGRSGTGKTVFGLKPLIKKWIDENCGGVLCLDPGKNKLPFDVADLLDLVVTPETVKINIIAGVPPEVAANILFEIAKQEAGDVWDKAVEADVRQGLFILNHIEQYPHLSAVAPYCLVSLYYFIEDAAYREAIIVQMLELGPIEDDHLKLSINHFQKVVPKMAEATRTSVQFNFAAWLSAFVLHPKMQVWAGHENEINIVDAVKKGARIGFSSAVSKYGAGGRFAYEIIKQTFFNEILNRKEGWRNTDQKQVALIVDECSAGIDESDMNFVKVAREQGCTMIYAVQDDEALTVEFGKKMSSPTEATLSFINNFSNFVTLKTSEETLRLRCHKAGQRARWIPAPDNSSSAPLMQSIHSEMRSGTDRNKGHLGEVIESLSGVLVKARKRISLDKESSNDEDNLIREASIIKGTIETRDTIEVEEVMPYLENPFHALVTFNRAKAPRREIVDLRSNLIQTGAPVPSLEDLQDMDKLAESAADVTKIEYMEGAR